MRERRMTLRQRIAAPVARRRDDAFLTREFLDLGGERQVLRALRELTEAGKLIRLGYGVYARAEISSLTQKPMVAGDGFGPVSRQVLAEASHVRHLGCCECPARYFPWPRPAKSS
jgi:hypothetical protein